MESDLPKDSTEPKSIDTPKGSEGNHSASENAAESPAQAGNSEQKSSEQPDGQNTAQPVEPGPKQSESNEKPESPESKPDSESSEAGEKKDPGTSTSAAESAHAENKTDSGTVGAESKPDDKAPAAEPEIKHVILVDDDPAFSDTVRAHFQEKNISLQTYTSKKELEEKRFEHPPTLLIMDIEVSGEDGRSLALDLRDAGKLGNAVIVLLTDAEMDKPTIEFTLKLGFRKILRKPVSANVLERLLLDEPRRKAAAEKKHHAATSSEDLQKTAEKDDDKDEGKKSEADAEGDDNAPLILSVKQSTPDKESKTSAIAQAMSTAMSMAPVKGASPGAAKANVDKFAPPPAPVRAPTPAQKPAPRSKVDDKERAPGSSSGSGNKGLLLGVAYSLVVALILGMTVSAGYVHSLMIGEGVLIGIAAGIGLIQGWKSAELHPSIVLIGASLSSFTGWVTLLIVRAVTDVPFVERTEAMIRFTKEHPNHIREWGTSESTALGFIIGQLIVAFIATMFLSRFRSTGKKTL
jgi:CheY-like chemotaxis protein